MGLCDSFSRYNDFKNILETVIKSYKHAKKNKFPNLEFFNYEFCLCEKLKIEFDKNLLEEIKIFADQNNNTLQKLIEEFRKVIEIMNSKILSITN